MLWWLSQYAEGGFDQVQCRERFHISFVNSLFIYSYFEEGMMGVWPRCCCWEEEEVEVGAAGQ